MDDSVIIYTDGACSGNPGPGGWGAVLRWRGVERQLSGSEAHTTNNRMELQAVIAALEALKRPVPVTLYTDSQYVQKGVTEWLPRWKARQWRTASGHTVANRDLWERLDQLAAQLPITWCWVKGHDGNEGNELADWLARQAIAAMQKGKTDDRG
ncbi:ribonuclease HI [Hydrogenophilus thermoluteolus]|uniref:Ribonuclease H n=1 Tax=Hydrogenophilus thermoluteolus TaxID=297 RepID=A0A2Z6DXZ5_HYDTE|nr:ribonuclease HI [Hydrogenophilus thermoluteolus]BBD77310.1 ribonuclease HI [Hydrogenophilus thermoluteolus]